MIIMRAYKFSFVNLYFNYNFWKFIVKKKFLFVFFYAII